MLAHYLNMPLMEEYRLPKILQVGPYIIYFWSNENNEPIHVHIAEKTPSANGTKVWLTKGGDTILANNKSNIPEDKLNKLLKLISDNFFFICSEWIKKFGKECLKFYC